jgi:hypothetical protein
MRGNSTMDNDEITGRLRALGQWEPPTSVALTTVARAGRRRRAAQVGGLSALAGVITVAATVAAFAFADGNAVSPAGQGVAPELDTTQAPASQVPGQARAAMAAAAPDPAKALDESTWADAPYWYVKTRSPDADSTDPTRPTKTREDWIAHHDRSLFIENGDPSTAWSDGPGGWTYDVDGPGADPWDGLFALPTDPAALEAVLRGMVADYKAGNPTAAADDDIMWTRITDTYPGSPAPTALRLAFLQVAKGLSGVVVTPGVTDGAGRTGEEVRFHYRGSGGEAYMIVDPTDGTVLEYGSWDYPITYLSMGPAWTLPMEPPAPICGPGSPGDRSC